MHEPTSVFLRTAAEAFELKPPVYEFGYCPAGDPADAAAMRNVFGETGYVGCELAGPAQLDRLADLSRLPFADAVARTVVCAGALEHVFEPPRAVEEMARILMPGGVLVLSAAVEPGDTDGVDNYWRLTPHVVERLLGPFEATLVAWQGPQGSPHTVFGVGCKAPVPAAFADRVNRLVRLLPARMAAVAPAGWLRRLLGLLARRGPRARKLSQHDLPVQFAVHVPLAANRAPEMLLGLAPGEKTGTRLDLSR